MSANRVNQTTGELIQYSGDVPTDKVGNLSAATTTDKSSVVAMVNEINSALANKANSSDLGDKSNLTTTDKSSVVAAINEVDGDLTRMISKLMFGGYSTYYRTTQTSIDGIVDNVVIAPQTDDTGYFSAENTANVTDYGNRQFVFGWVNTSKKYAWIIVCSFRGISVGTRENASAFTFKSLTS